jgi:hypothetical protein
MNDGGRKGLTTQFNGKAIHIQETDMKRNCDVNLKIESHVDREHIECLSNNLKAMYVFRRKLMDVCPSECNDNEDLADREAKATCSSNFEVFKEKRKKGNPESFMKKINGSSFKLVPKCGVRLCVND